MNMLQSIYLFPFVNDEMDQSLANIKKLCKLVRKTIADLRIGENEQHALSFTSKELSCLEKASCGMLGHEVSLDGDVILNCHNWFPAHGCVLLKWKTPFNNFHLELLMTDEWKCQGPHVPLAHMTAKANDYTILSCTPATFTQIQELNTSINARLLSDTNTKSQGERKPQKTPAYIYAIIQGVLTKSQNILPRGGTTDVGRHTGSSQRSTTWLIVSLCFHYLLDQSGNHTLFQKFLLHFHIRNLREYLASIKIVSLSKEIINTAMGILDAIVCQASVLTNVEDNKELACTVKDLRAELDLLVVEYHNKLYNEYKLPNSWKFAPSALILLPKTNAYSPCIKALTQNEIRRQALVDIQYTTGLDSMHSNFIGLLNFVNSPELNSPNYDRNQQILQILNATDKTFFTTCKQIGEDSYFASLNMAEIESMKKVLTIYRNNLQELMEKKHTFGRLRVQYRSHCLLIHWIACCMTHQYCKALHPLVGKFKMALDCENLSVVVTSDHDALDAVKTIHKYIMENSIMRPSVLFSLRDEGGTIDFARQFASNSSLMQNRLQYERAMIKQKEDKFWNEVQRKKLEAKNLRERINETESKQRKIKCELNDLNLSVRKAQDLNRRLSSEKRELSRLKSKLQDVLHAPPPIISPVPSLINYALPVIFSHCIPGDLAALGELSWLAQLMLIPKDRLNSITSTELLQLQTLPTAHTTWASHYNRYGNGSPPVIAAIVLYPKALSIPNTNQIGNACVDYINGPKDRTWYPDCGSGMIIHSLHTSNYNPFQLPPSWKDLFFTEILKIPLLQWMNMQPSSANSSQPLSRGNKSISSYLSLNSPIQRKLDQTAYLTLGSIRSFQYQQWRKIINAVANDTLPLNYSPVYTILRQAAFQVGDIDKDQNFQWHNDLLKSSLLDTAIYDFIKIANILRESPRRHQSYSLLGDLVKYIDLYRLSTMIASDQSLVDEFINVGWKWMEQAADDRAHQCFVISLTIAMFEYVDLSESDRAAKLLKLMLKFRYNLLFLRHKPKSTDADNSAIELQCLHVMTLRNLELMQVLASIQGACILQGAIESIYSKAPSSLKWCRVGSTTAFEGIDSVTGDQYLVDIISGRLLYNGSPPGSLPQSIRTAPIFRRLFGETDFEVLRSSPDRLRFMLINPVDGYYYVFEQRTDDNRVTITEIDIKEREWHAIDVNNSCMKQRWSCTLPVRLVMMHSHWYCPEAQIVQVRPVPFFKKTIDYLVDTSSGFCYKIENWDGLDTDTLLQHFGDPSTRDGLENIVQVPKSLTTILSKFEMEKFIHGYYTSSTAKFMIELPRYGLQFDLTVNNHQLVCRQYRNSILTSSQHIKGLFMSWSQYLVLTNNDDNTIQIITPYIRKFRDEQNATSVEIPKECDAKLNVFRYDLSHSVYGNVIKTSSVVARLHFASIAAHAGSTYPDKFLGLTGAECALDLVRQCWTNSPLNDAEVSCLFNIIKFSHLSPYLLLRCVNFLETSNQLRFLHGVTEVHTVNPQLVGDIESALKIRHRSVHPICDLRQTLNNKELMGARPTLNNEVNRLPVARMKVPTLLIDGTYVRQIEADMATWVVKLPRCNNKNQPFPFVINLDEADELRRDLLSGLCDSWSLHNSHDDYSLVEVSYILKILMSSKNGVESMRLYAEKVLLDFCNSNIDPMVDMYRACNRIAVVHRRDLVMAICDPFILKRLSPYLQTPEQIELFSQGIIVWMQLCVLEEKLKRCISLSTQNSTEELMRELLCVRAWSPQEHPLWLAFELDQNIQIRPEQYHLAQHLLDNPGSISQLNMGLGKTRVVIPMLILEGSTRKTTFRLHILSPLFSEALGYFQDALTSGVVRVPVSIFPFNRSVTMTPENIQAMHTVFNHCRYINALIVVAPEHRLSLRLKTLDQPDGDQTLRQMVRKIDESVVELFDESDALLHYQYELVYAVGTPKPLCQAVLRAEIMGAVLAALSNIDITPLRATGIMRKSCEDGEYPLVQCNEIIDEERLYHLLFERLLLDANDNLHWMKELDNHEVDKMRFAVTSMSESANNMLGVGKTSEHDVFSGERLSQVLMLRGLFAGGLLLHCLRLRHRVNYGVDSNRQQCAVPFSAADIPSPRNEFSNPDVCMMLTILSYFQIGLTIVQVTKSVETLLRMGSAAQQKYYTSWIAPIQGRENFISIDTVAKLDITNEEQMNIVHEYLSKSMKLVVYWLCQCVFPQEAMTFPGKVIASAWDLVGDSLSNIGFSGTNDQYKLLPSNVVQREPNIDSLLSTNGYMLDMILQHTLNVQEVNCNTMRKVYDVILEMVIRLDLDALIDTGSLLAGLRNFEAAENLACKLPSRFKGVMYFQPDEKNATAGQWMIMSCHTNFVESRSNSPIKDADCFVIFDEARCRGADMRLKKTAKSGLTLGERLTKDKLMQGAGRMRKLGQDQKLCIMIPSNLNHLKSASDVLRWVFDNTVISVTKGLRQWSQHGLWYSTTKESVESAVYEESWDLDTLYGGACIDSELPIKVVEMSRDYQDRNFTSISAKQREYCEQIERKIVEMGKNVTIKSVAHDEQSERELEEEKEEEKESEIQICQFHPSLEPRLQYRKVIQSLSVLDVHSIVPIHSLKDGVLLTTVSEISGIHQVAWDRDDEPMVYASKNFWTTIVKSNLMPLGLVDALLVFSDQTILLLSDREADGILTELLSGVTSEVMFVNLNRLSIPSGDHVGKNIELDKYSAIAIQLFAGNTMFPENSSILDEIIQAHPARLAIQELVYIRGRSKDFPLSDLQKSCSRLR